MKCFLLKYLCICIHSKWFVKLGQLLIVMSIILSLLQTLTSSLAYASSESISKNHSNSHHDNSTSSHHGITLASWRWKEVSPFLIVSLFVLISSLVKLTYHHTFLQAHLPESCILIFLGILFELFCYLNRFDLTQLPTFSSNIFFFVLLPPIILESAYSLHDRVFFNNLGTILLYAVIGTLMNIFIIAPLLWSAGQWPLSLTPSVPFIECLVFSTLIAAVDPVAVLAIFQEIGVNKALYFLVFGESLLNDAVVITVFNFISVFASSPSLITPGNIVLGCVNFITVSCGGLIIGFTWGALTSLITKFTRHVTVIEPLIVLLCAYLAYLTGELVHFSGIIALIGCGVMQAEYSRLNLSSQSYLTIKYITRNISSVADVIIFFFLGQVLVRETHEWSTSFTILVTVLCIIVRFISVFTLTYVANNWFHRVRMINFQEQIVMSCGGLRGAIAFSLSISISKSDVKYARLFVSTTLFVIIFTVFVLGSITKPIVKLLKVSTVEKEDPKMFLFLNDKLTETVISGIEDISGNRSYYHWMAKFTKINDKYIKPILCKNWQGNSSKFTQTFQRIRHRSAYRVAQDTQHTSVISDKGASPVSKNHPSNVIEMGKIDSSTIIHSNGIHRANSFGSTSRRRNFDSHSIQENVVRPVDTNSGGWLLVRNILRFTSALKHPNSVGPSENARSSSASHSGHLNSARRQLNSALSRTNFFQLPGSIILEEDHEE